MIIILPTSIIYVCSLVSLQVGTFQSNLSVSNPPNRSAFTQRCLLCDYWAPAGLHGHPQTDRHPVYKSTERRVSLPFYYDAQTGFYSTTVVENYTTYRGRVLWETRHLLCVYLLLRELELQRKSSATDIAKKKQEAESAVSTGTCKHAVIRCVCGIIDHCLWVPLSSLCRKTFYAFTLLLPPPPSCSYSFSLGSSVGSADAGICEENHRSGGI